MSNFYDDVQMALKVAIKKYGNARQLALSLDMNPSTITKWLETSEKKPQRSPNLRDIAPIMDSLGVRIMISGSEISQLEENEEVSHGSSLSRLEKLLAESERKRQVLVGEVQALERLLSKLMPLPPSQAPASVNSDQPPLCAKGDNNSDVIKKEDQLSGLATANG